MSRDRGDFWEDVAVRYLEDFEYIILDRNYNTKYGEIDIVAMKDDFIIFFEVKFRNDNEYGYSYEYVTKSKLNKIKKSVSIYLSSNKNYMKYNKRIDVIAFDNTSETLNHYKDIWID